MAQNTSEQWTKMGISHGLRWLWGALGLGGLALFLLLAAMVGWDHQSSERMGAHSTVLLLPSASLSQAVAPWRGTINHATRMTGAGLRPKWWWKAGVKPKREPWPAPMA
jgi:hypothetical protein